MRLLYVPFFSNANVDGCSVFNNVSRWLMAMVEADPKLFVYYLVPSNETWELAGLRNITHPRVMQIPVRCHKMQEDEFAYVAPEVFDLFNIDTGKYLVDLILTDKQRMTAWIAMLVNNKTKGLGGNVPVINVSQYQSGAEEAGWEKHYEPMLHAQVLGWCSGWNMWLSPLHYEKGLSLARKYVTASLVRRIVDQSYSGRASLIDCGKLDRAMVGVEKPRDEVWVHYASRFATSYEFEAIFEEIELMYQGGRPVKLMITSPSLGQGGAGGHILKEMTRRGMQFECLCPCPQDKFYEIAAKCHIALWMVQHQGVSLSLREQVYLGQVLVGPNVPNYQSVVPEYPYLYGDTTQRRGWLRRIADTYWSEEVQATVTKYRNHLRDQHDVAMNAPRIREFFRKVEQQSVPDLKAPRAMVKDVFEGQWPEEITYPELHKAIKQRTKFHVDIELNFRGTARGTCVKAFESFGYEDACDGPEPRYVRVKGAEVDGEEGPGVLREGSEGASGLSEAGGVGI